jgi:hypothetical protein
MKHILYILVFYFSAILTARANDTLPDGLSAETRCLSSLGEKPIQFEMKTYYDPSSKWKGGFVKYKNSTSAISIVLKSSEATQKPEGRPWEFTTIWSEVVGGKISGEYEIVTQGARVYKASYKNFSKNKQYDFDEDSAAYGPSDCQWE